MKSYVKEESVCRDKLDLKRLSEDSFSGLWQEAMRREILKTAQKAKRGNMQGTCNYNILSNQTYYDKYMYMPYTV